MGFCALSRQEPVGSAALTLAMSTVNGWMGLLAPMSLAICCETGIESWWKPVVQLKTSILNGPLCIVGSPVVPAAPAPAAPVPAAPVPVPAAPAPPAPVALAPAAPAALVPAVPAPDAPAI